jgi:hypothetical protein
LLRFIDLAPPSVDPQSGVNFLYQLQCLIERKFCG